MEKIKKLRKRIDKIDKEIIKLIAKRREIVLKIGKIKREKNLPIFDPKREKKIFEELKKIGKKYKVSRKLLKEIFQILIEDARKIQKEN